MAISPTFPGVYIEELPSGVRTLTGVATSVAAFIGYTARGLDHRAARIFSFSDFEREFGGLALDSELSYAVRQFYDNGGGEAWVVRVPRAGSLAAGVKLLDAVSGAQKEALEVKALSAGTWANGLRVEVDYDGFPVADTKSFNLTVTDLVGGATERFSVTMDNTKKNFVETVVNDEANGSKLVSAKVPDNTAGRPAQTGTVGADITADLGTLPIPGNMKITADLPAGVISGITVKVFEVGDVRPASVLGLARHLERKINAALGAVTGGAAVRCVPSASGKGLRIVADFDQEQLPSTADAALTITAGDANDIRATLKLDGANIANVGVYVLGKDRNAFAQKKTNAGTEGTGLPTSADLIGNPAKFTGIHALEKVDLFNILCLPDATRAQIGNPNALDSSVDPLQIFSDALVYCKKRRAFLLIDPPPEVKDVDSAADWKSNDLSALSDPNAAAYFPRVRLPDPLDDFNLRTFAPSGIIAGLYARTDGTRGVWKAPAGTEATLTGVRSLAYLLTDPENGVLNPLAVNCLRTFPVYGNVSWGARTLVGADAQASEWKYVPVRRLALFLEESLYRGTKWAVFEPNDEPLWAQLRLNIGAFMNNLFRQGAFAGRSPREAYLVKCDRETTTQDDINRGIVNILVAFAPLKPAEFVVIKIQQMAGQIQV